MNDFIEVDENAADENEDVLKTDLEDCDLI